MPSRECTQCQRRLPFAARRCRFCGWSRGDGVDSSVVRAHGRRRTVLWLLLALLIAAVGGLATARAADFAEWYAAYAAQHLPDRLASFAPGESERGAYLYCARRVVKTMDGEPSVETFPDAGEADARYLGEGRYRIRSWVEQVTAEGERVRHTYVCVTRYERGSWALERLTFENPYALGRAQ